MKEADECHPSPAFPGTNPRHHALCRLRREYGVQPSEKCPSPIDLKYRFDGYNKFLDPDGYPAVQPPWGTLNAIDLNTGEFAWKIPFGEYPELAEKGLRNTGSENYGGPVVTAAVFCLLAQPAMTGSFTPSTNRPASCSGKRYCPPPATQLPRFMK